MPKENTIQTQENKEEELQTLKNALERKGISIKDLVDEYKAFKAGEGIVEKCEKKKPKNKKNYSSKKDVSFELVTADYPDFCIRKKTAKTEKLLIIMPSCGAYFIKNIKHLKGKEEEISREELNRDNYAAFTSGMTPIDLNDYWLNNIQAGVNFYDTMKSYLNRESIDEMIKKHCAPKMDGFTHRDISDQIEAYQAIPNLYREFHENKIIKSFMINNKEFIKEIQDVYSLEKARIFLNRLAESNLYLGCEEDEDFYELDQQFVSEIYNYAYDDEDEVPEDFDNYEVYNRIGKSKEGRYERVSSRPNINMDFEKMCDYVLVQSVRMGYRRNMHVFFEEWNDCLKMQHQLFKKIVQKYPSNLPTYHMVLSSDVADAKIEIDKAKLAKVAEHYSKYDATVGDYVFVCPKSKEMILDEAAQQSNCLASYVDKYTNGRCYLVFMRTKKDPKKSLVTIEILGDKISQKYQALNRTTTAEQDVVINKWLKNIYLKRKNED